MATRRSFLCSRSRSKLVVRVTGAPSTDTMTCPALMPAMSAGLNGITSLIRKRPLVSYSPRSKRTPMRPVTGAVSAADLAGAGNPEVRRIQLPDHERDQPPYFIRCAGAFDLRTEARAHGRPVDAVELGIVEVIVEVAPRLPEDLGLLFGEGHIHLRRDGDRLRLAAFDVDGLQTSAFEVQHFFAVGRPLRVTFRRGRRGQLAGDRRLPSRVRPASTYRGSAGRPWSRRTGAFSRPG